MEGVRKEPGDEQREVADLPQAFALADAAAFERLRQADGEGHLVVGPDRPLQKTGEQPHDVERSELLCLEALMRQGAIDQLLEIGDRRFLSKYGFTHTRQ